MKALFFIALLLMSCFIANGQPPQPKIVSAGVLNGKATSLPKPEYPDSARQARVEGEIKVKVLIDESGKVLSATAGEGPEDRSLRIAAESAALKATFSPTLLAGNPVKVSGRVCGFIFIGGGIYIIRCIENKNRRFEPRECISIEHLTNAKNIFI